VRPFPFLNPVELELEEHAPMPTFDTSEPITATIELAVGDVQIATADAGATVVDVRPSDPSNDDDVKAAASTRIEYAHGTLLIKAPKRAWSTRRGGSIDVDIELPSGSHVRGTGHVVDFRADGRLGDCHITTGLGRIRLDQADRVNLRNGIGDISIERASGHAEVRTGSGELRMRELDASSVIKNSNGDTWVGVAAGDVRVNAANGSIAVDLAEASVVARSANGDVRLGEVVRGSVVLETKIGDLDVGIREGTAVWVDASASAGTIHRTLDPASAPEQSAERVELRARTSVGEIAIRRAEGSDTQRT
jgi:hypothetical protein